MLELETVLEISDIVESPNVAELLSEEDRKAIGRTVHSEWEIDKVSRQDWEQRTARAFELALQVTEEKTFPWPNASNVKFPLITIAALQYHARAYPGLLPGSDVVKCRIFGEDPDGIKRARADRISAHMSYQVLEEDESWEDHMDRVLITQPIVGCAFKKTFFDKNKQYNCSEHVFAKDLYIPYYAASLEDASRITQILYLSENDVISAERSGLWCGGDHTAPTRPEMNELVEVRDKTQGLHSSIHDPATPYTYLEQHRYLDLDGDGYAEPYIVTVREDTKETKRIVARYTSAQISKNKKGEITHIDPIHYFTKFSFIPSPDGGIYDLGFGALLGPLNESIDTLINQLIDGGTLANTAGGFLGRGAKFKSGENTFAPFEWRRVDSTGDDLRKSVFPLPVREPSAVLLNLLGILVNYGERIAGATDPQVGENPGQNTPAETSRNMLVEGGRVFSSIFKRTYRALKKEFRKLYKLNRTYLNEVTEYYALASDYPATVLQQDYMESEKSICPAADPSMITESQKLMQAQMLKQAAMSSPGYNVELVERKFLAAIGITNISEIYPGPQKLPPGPDPKVQTEKMWVDVKMAELELQQRLAALELMSEAEHTQAKIGKLQAETVKLLAEAEGVDTGHQVAMLNAQIGAAKAHQESIYRAIEILQKGREQKSNGQG